MTCICGHTQKEHLSDELHNACQSGDCGCSCCMARTQKQKERLAPLCSLILRERGEADQIVLECELTEYLQQQVNCCNLHLKNFQLRLEMDVVKNVKTSIDAIKSLIQKLTEGMPT